MRAFIAVLLSMLAPLGAPFTALAATAHDPERTEVVITFTNDGAFQIDVWNDPDWLLERLEPFSGLPLSGRLDPGPRDRRLVELTETFARWVWVYFDDERAAVQVEYLPPPAGPIDRDRPPLARMRLSGRRPEGAMTFYWAYGLVMDPYPMLMVKGDGRVITHWVAGDLESDRFRLAALTPPMRGEVNRPWYHRGTAWAVAILVAAVAFYRLAGLAARDGMNFCTRCP